jgi:hypothetical protein
VSEAKGEVREQLGNMFAKLMIKNPKSPEPAQEEDPKNMVPVMKGAQKRNDKNKEEDEEFKNMADLGQL